MLKSLLCEGFFRYETESFSKDDIELLAKKLDVVITKSGNQWTAHKGDKHYFTFLVNSNKLMTDLPVYKIKDLLLTQG
jgi:hypothetical protein